MDSTTAPGRGRRRGHLRRQEWTCRRSAARRWRRPRGRRGPAHRPAPRRRTAVRRSWPARVVRGAPSRDNNAMDASVRRSSFRLHPPVRRGRGRANPDRTAMTLRHRRRCRPGRAHRVAEGARAGGLRSTPTSTGARAASCRPIRARRCSTGRACATARRCGRRCPRSSPTPPRPMRISPAPAHEPGSAPGPAPVGDAGARETFERHYGKRSRPSSRDATCRARRAGGSAQYRVLARAQFRPARTPLVMNATGKWSKRIL